MRPYLSLLILPCALAVEGGRTTLALDHGTAAGEASQPAVFTAQQIKLRLLPYERLLELYVKFRVRTHQPSNQSLGPDYVVERTLAAKSPHNFFYDSSHTRPGLIVRDDPYRQLAYYTSGLQVGAYPLDRRYFQRPWSGKASLGGTLATEFFTVSSGLWALNGREAPTPIGVPHVLQDVAQSAIHNRVNATLDRVGDVACHVLVCEGRDSLWLDVSEDDAKLMRRELRNADTGALISRYTLSQHRRLAKGVWCPMNIRSEQFMPVNADDSTDARDPRKFIDSDARLVEAVSRVPSEIEFEFTSQPGWLRLNEDDVSAPPVQEKAGGIDHLDELSDWIVRTRLSKPSPKTSLAIPKLGVLLVMTWLLAEYSMRPRSIDVRLPRGAS